MRGKSAFCVLCSVLFILWGMAALWVSIPSSVVPASMTPPSLLPAPEGRLACCSPKYRAQDQLRSLCLQFTLCRTFSPLEARGSPPHFSQVLTQWNLCHPSYSHTLFRRDNSHQVYKQNLLEKWRRIKSCWLGNWERHSESTEVVWR